MKHIKRAKNYATGVPNHNHGYVFKRNNTDGKNMSKYLNLEYHINYHNLVLKQIVTVAFMS